MAKYNYDEAGNMAAYFLITFLALVLVPTTLAAIKPSPQNQQDGCQCTPCINNRRRLQKYQTGSLLPAKVSKRTLFLLLGWSILAYVSYRVVGAVADNKVYDPFEILGIATGTSEKEIKAHFKRLSRMYHPDKVKVTANQTIDMIQQKFVDITKAYKSLTDETIRKNWELYGNPDGRQEMSMGIALPQWIIESKNNVWVLGVYGLVFGGALPALVGRWWFGSRTRTKDGVHALSAAEFFKSLREESKMDQVVTTFAKSYSWEHSVRSSNRDADEIQKLGHQISSKAGKAWTVVLTSGNAAHRRGFVLMYAHLLRLEIKRPSLVKEQIRVLQQSPLLLNSLLNITLARNWLFPALDVMRLHAYLMQALPPTIPYPVDNGAKTKLINPHAALFSQLPGISSTEEADTIAPSATSYTDFVRVLEDKKDSRVSEIQKVLSTKWGHVDLVDVAFRVIGERVVSPSSIVYLVVKLRLKSPIDQPSADPAVKKELDADGVKRRVKFNDEQEEEFLKSRGDAEDLGDATATAASFAHAPYWPGERKPSWWIALADDKSNRVVVPPIKITDIPYARCPDADTHEALLQHDYRAYKIQFQSPPNIGMFTWKVYIVSDTFVGEEVTRNIAMKIEEAPVSAADEVEDEISDPEEDSLAGQMAAMRGGSVKKHKEESDDDSSDEDSEEDNSSSDSDSD